MNDYKRIQNYTFVSSGLDGCDTFLSFSPLQTRLLWFLGTDPRIILERYGVLVFRTIIYKLSSVYAPKCAGFSKIFTKYSINSEFSNTNGALPSNTIPNPREEVKVITTQSGMTLAGPSVPPPPPSSSSSTGGGNQYGVAHGQKFHPSPVPKSNEIPERNPHQPSIPYPSRCSETFINNQFGCQLWLYMHTTVKMILKASILLRSKLLDLANNPLYENFHRFSLNVTRETWDPGKFLSFNVPELVPTRMTLELASRLVAYPARIAEDVFVQVGRPYLRMACALVDVHGEELILRVGDEKSSFNVDSTLKYPHKHGNESINMIDIIENILFLENLLKDEPSETEKSEINPLIGELFDTFLMREKEIKFNPLKDIDDPIPILRVSKTSDSLDSFWILLIRHSLIICLSSILNNLKYDLNPLLYLHNRIVMSPKRSKMEEVQLNSHNSIA
ncbi:hypothetical protein Tco_0218622 [Tanacetum coccineum]